MREPGCRTKTWQTFRKKLEGRMATIRDVAKLAGVSMSTVSRTLSGKIFVEEKTREKVLEAVEKLHYRPNLLARGLRAGSTGSIAFLVPDIDSLFYPRIMKSLEKAASRRDYSVSLYSVDNSLEKEKQILNTLSERGVDGVICMSTADEPAHLADFQRQYSIPVVLVNRSYSGEDLSCVMTDDEEGAYLSAVELLKAGHRRLCGVFGSFSRERFRLRFEGFRRAAQEYGVRESELILLRDVNTIQDAYEAMGNLLDQEIGEKPDAVFTSMDMLAVGCYSAAQQRGYRIPEDLSFTGFDDIYISKYLNPPLTTCRNPADELAEGAMELLVKQIADPAVRQKLMIRGSVILRDSVLTRSM